MVEQKYVELTLSHRYIKKYIYMWKSSHRIPTELWQKILYRGTTRETIPKPHRIKKREKGNRKKTCFLGRQGERGKVP